MGDCLAALSDQKTSYSYEIIVVDNGSSEINEVIGKYGRRVRLVINEEINPYSSRNLGIRLAKSDIIGLLDAKCTPREDWVETIVKEIRESPKAIIAGNYLVDAPGERLKDLVYGILYLNNEKNVRRKYGVTAGNLCMSKDAFHHLGFFSTEGESGHDIEWTRRILLDDSYELKYNPQLVVSYQGNAYSILLQKVKKYAKGMFNLNRKDDKPFRRHLMTIFPYLFPMRPGNFSDSLRARRLEGLSNSDKFYLYFLTWEVKLSLAKHYFISLLKHKG